MYFLLIIIKHQPFASSHTADCNFDNILFVAHILKQRCVQNLFRKYDAFPTKNIPRYSLLSEV